MHDAPLPRGTRLRKAGRTVRGQCSRSHGEIDAILEAEAGGVAETRDEADK